ncbi:hypothetical protein [Clostridium pasteurianum]|uniref:Phage protein, HK97 gp10 family n=1 Tax=Clostridium pasteurianum BC1 TaxID=86416 RepID=R4KAT9_CLOPA|nr:hypothetical protein [Clostridium pasteurianum]AGK97629.1 hypothetical protein Clopa_2791 [Clostridium pasteurianum BC1]
MGLNWYGEAVKQAINGSKKEICTEWGVLLQAAYQARTPVISGNMKAHETFQVHDDNSGVDIGTTEVNYSIDVELGSSKQKAQHILENTVNGSTGKIVDVASKIISSKMGG